ncbi:hypothetical protein BS78_01G087100 [Paspalum vaginatum]|nr:hypothetical protein BS78_01G087100 [Paspalum vaginatum]
MGACNSCEATAAVAAAPRSTSAEARVVLADGALRRFPGGTRASQAVKAAGAAASWFLCSADGLELGGAVAAVGSDEALQPGQLYFVLPAAMRRRPLQAEEMAALAIRASAALVGDHDGGPLVFPEAAAGAGAGAGARPGKACRRSRRGSSRGRDFVPDLGAITE